MKKILPPASKASAATKAAGQLTKPQQQEKQQDVVNFAEAAMPLQEARILPTDVVIGIMGLTGSGKSTLISLLTEEEIEIGHSLQSCTSAVGIYCCFYEGKRIYLVDTPGFNDTYRSDTEVLKDVAYYLSTLYAHNIKLAGLIYLHSIMDQRMTGSALKNLHMFEKLCGKNCLPNIVLATTKWDLLKEGTWQTGVQREQELLEKRDFWGFMVRGGSKVVRHDGSEKSARGMLSYLVERKESVVLEIQRQMVDERQTLENTAAGHLLQEELLKARKQHQREVQELKESLEHAYQEKNEYLAQELEAQQRKYEEEIEATYKDREDLKIDLERLIEERRQQYEARLREMDQMQRDSARRFESQQEELKRTTTRLEEMERQREQQNQSHEARVAELLESHARLTEENRRRSNRERASQEQAERERAEAESMRYEQEMRHKRALEFQAALEAARQNKRNAAMSIVKVLSGISVAGMGAYVGSPTVAAAGLGMFRGALTND